MSGLYDGPGRLDQLRWSVAVEAEGAPEHDERPRRRRRRVTAAPVTMAEPWNVPGNEWSSTDTPAASSFSA